MSRSVEFWKTNVSQAADSELRVSVPRRRKRSLAGQMIEGAELRLQVFRDIYGHGHLLAYAQERPERASGAPSVDFGDCLTRLKAAFRTCGQRAAYSRRNETPATCEWLLAFYFTCCRKPCAAPRGRRPSSLSGVEIDLAD